MPELPEVETIVRRLRRVLPGRRVEGATVLRDNVVKGSARRFARALEGATVEGVERRAKFIATRLDGGRVWVTHLRMTGRYQVEPPRSPQRARAVHDARAAARPELPLYTRAVFDLSGGARLLYIDARALGEMEVLSDAAWAAKAGALGPEPLAPDFTPELLAERLAVSRRPVKEVLLDQTRVAGIGNIYASEALWRARISPRRQARNVGPVRSARLHRAIVDVLTEAVGKSGTSLGETLLDYTDADGAPGEFYDLLNVYDREGQPCRRCGTPIRRITQGQRSTYFCPGCQR